MYSIRLFEAKFYVAIDIRGNLGDSEIQQKSQHYEVVEFTLILVEASTKQLVSLFQIKQFSPIEHTTFISQCSFEERM